jgi:hypothetical protein
MKKGMTESEFKEWKIDWYEKVPKCDKFVCCHELMSCGIKIFCGDCSIYSTYSKDKKPEECTTVGCDDCMVKYECENYKCGNIDDKFRVDGGNMKSIIKCVDKDCGHKEPASGGERLYRGRTVNELGNMVLCSICNSQTILIDDK